MLNQHAAAAAGRGKRLPQPITLLVIVFAALLSAACTTHGQGPSRLSTAEMVPPPQGLFQFCVGRLEMCGVVASEAKADDGAKAEIEAPAPLTDDMALALAERVNAQVNVAISYRTDMEQWGRAEAWVLPLSEEGVAYGDCEDYALEKRSALLGLGVPEDRLALATAWSDATGLHAVLLLRTEAADYVLDNTTPHILTVGQTSYNWISVQSGQNLFSWARVQTPFRTPDDAELLTAG